MMIMRKIVFFATAAALQFQVSTVFAQASSTAGAPSDSTELETIVITSEKIALDSQKVALPVTIVEQETMSDRGVDSARDLQRVVAGLQSIGDSGNFSIRGVKTDAATPFATAAVAFSQDGVTLGRFQNSAGLVYDVERVEVLKGPQGSLSGTNASGGSISVVSKSPVLGRFEGNAGIETGNYSTLRTNGALNLPFGDAVAVRMAWSTSRHGGYFDNAPAVDRGTADTQSGRIRMLVQPLDALKITLGANYQTDKSVSFTRPVCYSTDPAANCPYGVYPDARTYPLHASAQSFVNNKLWGAQLDIEWDFGFASLTVLPAYNQFKSTSNAVSGQLLNGSNATSSDVTNTLVDGINDPISQTLAPVGYQDFSQKSLEARLSHSGSKLRWVFGGITSKEDNQIVTALAQSTTIAAGQTQGYYSQTRGPQNTESKALFGQATVSLTDKFRVTAGARWSDDYKLDGLINCDNGNPVSDTDPTHHTPSQTFTAAQCVSNVSTYEKKYGTYRGGFEYDVLDDSMVYLTVTTGLHPGTINSVQVPVEQRYVKPEKLVNYEIGAKNRFLNDRLQVNASIFYLDYKDFQVTYTFNENPILGGTLNAAAAVSKGVDFDTLFAATDKDRINFNGQYLDAKFTKFDIINYVSGQAPQRINYNGKTLANSPKWTLNLGYEHRFDLINDGGSLLPRLDVHYESAKKVSVFQEFAIAKQSSLTTVDFTTTYQPANGSWRVVGFVRNLTDELYWTNFAGGMGFTEPLRGTVSFNDPRTYGVRFETSF